MVKLTSADLHEKVKSAGIKYLPADQKFYKVYPYKVELSPRFKGLGGVTGKRGCSIDISDPVKARQKLATFTNEVEMAISNVEYRQNIKNFIDELPEAEYHSRLGGENSLFYFRDPELVLIMIERYKDVINSVTGPVSANHSEVIEDRNVLMRESLYYGKFRFSLEFPFEESFVTTAKMLRDYLETLNKSQWRASRLDICISHFEYHAANGTQSPRNRRSGWTSGSAARKLNPTMIHTAIHRPFPRVERIFVYLADVNDYIYIKLLAGEFLLDSHEVMTFDELT